MDGQETGFSNCDNPRLLVCLEHFRDRVSLKGVPGRFVPHSRLHNEFAQGADDVVLVFVQRLLVALVTSI
jgi:hypothetical protein